MRSRCGWPEQPDIFLRALLAELAERGIKVSYYVV